MAGDAGIAYRVAMSNEFFNQEAGVNRVAVASPCIGICRIGVHEHCVGCGRDLDEITAWSRASEALRRTICARAAARLLQKPEPV